MKDDTKDDCRIHGENHQHLYTQMAPRDRSGLLVPTILLSKDLHFEKNDY